MSLNFFLSSNMLKLVFMKKIIGYLFLSAALLCITPPIFAQGFEIEFCNPPNNTAIQTSLGCIDTTPNGIAQNVFRIALGLGGGIAFLLIILGAIQIQTSTGNPEQLNSGREIIQGAIAGLLLIIFSVFILKFIGVDILGIPGFH